MIYSLTGKVSRLGENLILVDTGAVGYEVNCSSFAAQELSSKLEPQAILTYLQVREDAVSLYGFKDRAEKTMFYDLIGIPGIAAKAAINILSGLDVDRLVSAVMSSDVKTILGIKGVGRKTAEDIVLKLSNKYGKEGALEKIMSTGNLQTGKVLAKEIDEAVQVLTSTGVQKSKALDVAKANYRDGMTSEELVVACFKNLR